MKATSGSNPLSALVKGADAVQLIGNLVTEVGDWVRVVNDEKTKQIRIQADAETQIAAIRRDGKLLLGYLDRSFDERRELFKQHFEALSIALKSGSTEQVAAVLGAITTLAVKSPFADLADIESIRATWTDADQAITI
jgi:hypothetical protein